MVEAGGVGDLPLISICIPVHNASPFIAECLKSVINQTYIGPVEVSIFDDCSSDDSASIIVEWASRFESREKWSWKFSQNTSSMACGAGFARNRVIQQSSGVFVCSQDADDIMLPQRVELQLQAFREQTAQRGTSKLIVGSQFHRLPADATAHYTQWANSLLPEQLILQQYRELTIIQPTWFFPRQQYDEIGGYEEFEHESGETTGAGRTIALAEDLRFFHKHLDRGGVLHKVEQPLVIYRHAGTNNSGGGSGGGSNSTGSESSTVSSSDSNSSSSSGNSNSSISSISSSSSSNHNNSSHGGSTGTGTGRVSLCSQTPRRLLLRLRVRAFERRVLSQQWAGRTFTIWGAGRDGKQFFNTLHESFRHRVSSFCDVDEAKIKRDYHWVMDNDCSGGAAGADKTNQAEAGVPPKKKKKKKRHVKRIPIIHFSEARPPIVCCVAMGRTDGRFEANVTSLNLKEGQDYWHFN